MNAIIIEDEKVAAQSLQQLIQEVSPETTILSVLQSIEESVTWLQSHAMPDLIFMDIHLADGYAFAIFDSVDISCPVIFTTAYDEYALKAFQVNSIDYLLKPINVKDLERAIKKYRHISAFPSDQKKFVEQLLNSIKGETKNYRTTFLVHFQDKLTPLPVSDVAFFYIDEKNVKAFTFKQQSYLLDQTLDEIAEQLNPKMFFRANRQFIVSRVAIKDMNHWFGNKLTVNLTVPAPEKIIVSKAKSSLFKEWVSEN